jgi:hypothetical protein
MAEVPPTGFTAIIGNPAARAPTPSQFLQYKCFKKNPNGGDDIKTFHDSFPPPTSECFMLRANIRMGSCSNGENTSEDHQSHIAFDRTDMRRTCPDSHPKRLVELTMESYWDLKAIKGAQDLIWAHGDTTGYGYHGDIMNGWDQSFLQEASEKASEEARACTRACSRYCSCSCICSSSSRARLCFPRGRGKISSKRTCYSQCSPCTKASFGCLYSTPGFHRL